MAYVEWLRVRQCLKVTAIVLAALLVMTGIARIWLAASGVHDAAGYVSGLQADPGSHVAHTTLPDGTARTTIDNAAKGVRVVIDDRGSAGKQIQIVERAATTGHRNVDFISMGNVNIDSTSRGGYNVTTIRTGTPTYAGLLFAVATVVALIVATILGAPFARENDGHLEIALTKPVGRERLALSIIGVDLVGILAAWVLAVAALVAGHLLFELPHYVLEPDALPELAVCLAGCAAWYGILTAATASLRRGYWVVLAFSWLVASIVATLGKAQLGSSQIGQAIHLIVTPFARIDPITYLRLGPAIDVETSAGAAMQTAIQSFGHNLTMLVILAVVYLALAVLQWRRVEA